MSPRLLRALLHASTTSVVLLARYAPSWFRPALIAGGAGGILFEALRLSRPTWQQALANRIPVFRPTEATRPSGAGWLLLGYALAACFPPPAAVAGILVGGLADPAATIVGTRFGAARPKSWPGTAAAWVAGGLALRAIGWPMWVALFGATVGAALERSTGPVDDNLIIAPGVALAVWILS